MHPQFRKLGLASETLDKRLDSGRFSSEKQIDALWRQQDRASQVQLFAQLSQFLAAVGQLIQGDEAIGCDAENLCHLGRWFVVLVTA